LDQKVNGGFSNLNCKNFEHHSQSSESLVRESNEKTRRKFSAEEKIRVVLDGFPG
jgi:hypothetical protein